MFRDLGRARSLREFAGYVFGPPGWRPDGTGPTAANLRAAWLRGESPATAGLVPLAAANGRLPEAP